MLFHLVQLTQKMRAHRIQSVRSKLVVSLNNLQDIKRDSSLHIDLFALPITIGL